MKSRLLLFLLIIINTMNASYASYMTLTLHNANLPEAIRLLAKEAQMNIILDEHIQGNITIQLTHVPASQALDLLLAGTGLAKWRQKQIWFIGPRDAILRQRQAELQLNNTINSTKLVTQIWRIRYSKAADIAQLIANEKGSLLSKQGQLHVDTRTNSVYIRDTSEHIQTVQYLVKHIDVPVKQIRIEARLVSIDSDFERDLGIDFGVSRREHVTNQEGAINRVVGQYRLPIARLADGSLLDVKLSAMEKSGHAELISSPSLFTTNRVPAFIESGEEVPYQEISESGGTAVAFKKAVLSLQATPQILPGKKVLLTLKINQDRPTNRTVLGVPTINTRQIKTNVLVRSGETIVLGGIYEAIQEKGSAGLPFIQQIPFIAKFLTQRNLRRNKRELLIFVTPNIVTTT